MCVNGLTGDGGCVRGRTYGDGEGGEDVSGLFQNNMAGVGRT